MLGGGCHSVAAAVGRGTTSGKAVEQHKRWDDTGIRGSTLQETLAGAARQDGVLDAA